MSQETEVEQSEPRVDLAVQMYEIQVDTALKTGLDLRQRTVQIFGIINEEMLSRLDTCLGLLEAEPEDKVTVRIHSEGGSVTEALAMVSRIRSSPLVIDTEVHGIAYSAAIMLLAAGTGERRMSRLSWAMSHEASYGVEGTHTAIKHAVKQAEREEQAWSTAMSSFTKAPADFWRKKGRLNLDLYLTAQECLELGVCDKLF